MGSYCGEVHIRGTMYPHLSPRVVPSSYMSRVLLITPQLPFLRTYSQVSARCNLVGFPCRCLAQVSIDVVVVRPIVARTSAPAIQ